MKFREERDLTAIGVIPARIASTRLPAKPLHKINGKTLIERVWERASAAKNLNKLVVATDSQEIIDAVRAFGGEAIMTSPDLPTGTDRIYKAVQEMGDDSDLVFNIQGDEPLLIGEDLDLLFNRFAISLCDVGTLIKRIDNTGELFADSVVKVALEMDNKALYFSRSPIPFTRGVAKEDWLKNQTYWKHIGIYCYRRKALDDFFRLPQTDLEVAESLEQLRLLQNGNKFLCVETKNEYFAIDTPEDVAKVENYMTANGIA